MTRSVRWMALAASLVSTGCGGDADTLPGHRRPILQHGWADPGALALDAIAFTPPDPAAALFEATSGARAYIATDAAAPLVRLTAALPLGRLHEAAGEAGASALLTQLLTTRGAAGATRPLSLRLAELGTTLGAEETLDLTILRLEVLPEDWKEGLALLVGLIRNPDLDAPAVLRYRSGTGYTMPMAGIGGQGFRPKVELERRVAGYPLAPPDSGTAVSPAAIDRLASRALRANRVVLSVGGAVERAAVEAEIESLTRGWTSGSEPAPAAAPLGSGRSGGLVAIDAPSLEGWIAIGNAIGPVPAGDQAALAVLRFILAERLNVAAREIRGLTNRDDFEIPVTGSGAGLMTVRTGGRPEAVAPLVRFSLEEIKRLHDPQAPISDAEVARAKGWLVHAVWQPSLELATTASATFAAQHVRYGTTARWMDWPRAVRAVTAAEVKSLARRHLDPAGLVTVVVGPLARIRAARHPRWPVALSELEAAATRP